MILKLTIHDAVDDTAVIDTLNEALRELAEAGAIIDDDDNGWAWQ
jgi:hypothetical protein